MRNLTEKIFADIINRLGREMFFSMLLPQSQHSHWPEHWRSKTIENLRNYGTPQPKLSRPEITKLPQMRRPRSKICKETKQLDELKKVSNGNLDSSDPSEVDLADLRKARRIWIGF